MHDRLISLNSQEMRGTRSTSLQERSNKTNNPNKSSKPRYHHEIGLLENNAQTVCKGMLTAELDASIRRQLGLRSNTMIMPGSTKSIQQSRNYTTSLRNTMKPVSPKKPTIEYNKWYIDPKLRYLKRQENPKNNIRAYANQDFIYRNLHNQYFWDWRHPFDKVQSNQTQELSSKQLTVQADELAKNKGNLRVLEEFRRYTDIPLRKLEDSRARLPLIVKEVLQSHE